MKYLAIFSFLFLFLACTETDDELTIVTDELIVGLSYGECGGDCAFLYLLKDDLIYVDEGVDRVADDPIDLTFSAIPLVGTDQLRYDSLFSQLPSGLDNYESEDFGCPDCGDWGSLHVIRSTEAGVYKSYILDNQTGNMAASLQGYGRLLQRSLIEFRR